MSRNVRSVRASVGEPLSRPTGIQDHGCNASLEMRGRALWRTTAERHVVRQAKQTLNRRAAVIPRFAKVLVGIALATTLALARADARPGNSAASTTSTKAPTA
jgi:hypothetical protein